ncbi:MAG: amidohydrolase, partial [Maricaulaceae bacterium]
HPIMAAVLLPMEFITPEDWELPRGMYEGVRTPEGYHARLKNAIAAHTGDGPFFTWGWHPLWHGDITRADLNDISTELPLFIWHRSFHEIVMNDAALAVIGLSNETDFDAALAEMKADPHHASFDKGWVSESAAGVAIARLAPTLLSPKHLNTGFTQLKGMIRASGVTTIADMATGIFADFDTETGLMAMAFETGDTPVRAMLVPVAHNMAMREGSVEAALAKINIRKTNWPYTRLFLGNRVKLLSDGAFFSQYMQMNAPGYSDGHEGKWITPPEGLRRFAMAFWEAGYSVHTHVNGDKGVDVVLDMLEGLRESGTAPDQRFILEHLGYSTEVQNERIAELGAAVSAQPNYLYVLSDLYAKHGLGPERAHAMNRLGSLEAKGVPVALHSDTTMAPVDPLFLAWIAANRENIEGDVVRPDERLSLDAALRSITIDAAYAIGQEAEIGSIAVGKRADFTVLKTDPHEVGAAGLRDIEIAGVVFGGETFVKE